MFFAILYSCTNSSSIHPPGCSFFGFHLPEEEKNTCAVSPFFFIFKRSRWKNSSLLHCFRGPRFYSFYFWVGAVETCVLPLSISRWVSKDVPFSSANTKVSLLQLLCTCMEPSGRHWIIVRLKKKKSWGKTKVSQVSETSTKKNPFLFIAIWICQSWKTPIVSHPMPVKSHLIPNVFVVSTTESNVFFPFPSVRFWLFKPKFAVKLKCIFHGCVVNTRIIASCIQQLTISTSQAKINDHTVVVVAPLSPSVSIII